MARPRPALKISVDLAALVRQTTAILEPLARERHSRILFVGEQPTLQARGDASKLLQILTNLTMNAIQSMPRGGNVRLSVAMRSTRPPNDSLVADYLCIDVMDEGEGIPDTVRPHIFETFFTTKQAGEGTGLGLSVAYRLAREHGGWIGVESTLGTGSCFTLYLPPLVPGPSSGTFLPERPEPA